MATKKGQSAPEKDNPKKTRGLDNYVRPQNAPKSSSPKDKSFLPVKSMKGKC